MSYIYELYTNASPDESFATSRKTGWIPVSDLDRKNFLRRFNARFESADNITVNIYVDGDESTAVWTGTLSTNLSTAKFISSRVGRRARYFMIEITTTASVNYNTEMKKIQVETDE